MPTTKKVKQMSKIRTVDFSMHSNDEIAAFISGIDNEQMERVENAIAQYRVAAKLRQAAELRSELEAVAARHGVSLSDALKSRVAGGTGTVAAKYHNPANTSQTWTGRGRSPLWVTAHETAHGNRDGLLIESAEAS
jgi:DNA-binding protein H-NS